MKTERQHAWTSLLRLFSNENRLRPTRIAVFEGTPDDMTDYWLEDGLPLNGLDIDPGDGTGPTIEIMLGSAKSGSRELTHVVKDARLLKLTLSVTGEADGLEVVDAKGTTTIMRFEES